MAEDPCGQATHEVLNQARPLRGNAFDDPPLRQGLARLARVDAQGLAALEALGAKVGSEEWQQKASEANRQVPRLECFDGLGARQDAVSFHPAYHELMHLGLSSGVASFAWQYERPGAHLVRCALSYLMYQLDPGVCCPLTMTFAAVPVLKDSGAFVETFREKLISGRYDGRDLPLSLKEGATCGMSMTEKQGGSDVRANQTQARPAVLGKENPGDAFWLIGHKWFTSAPMSDGFLTLAKSREGVSCFLVPRWRPDGRRNFGFQLQRLKEKIGDKSNASSEVEYRNAWGVLVGKPGRGVQTIVEMVVHTRLDCVIGSSALMRRAAQLAAHHASERWAFGRPLIQQPLMRHVVADLALESEASMACWLRLASLLEAREPNDQVLLRGATAICKFYVCKRAPQVAQEAMECHGGNGYVDDSPIARLFRQSPLNAIWEGSSNVICLDLLRSLRREPETGPALLQELREAEAASLAAEQVPNAYSSTLESLEKLTNTLDALELQARDFVERLAICFQASSLLQYGDPRVAQAYLATRLPQQGVVTTCLGSRASSLSEDLVDHLLSRLRSSELCRL